MRNWIDLYYLTPDEAGRLPEAQRLQWADLQLRQQRREKNRCGALPLFLYRVQRLYEQSTGLSFRELWGSAPCQESGNLISEALGAVREKGAGLSGESGGAAGFDMDSVDFGRNVEEWSVADMEIINSCLRYSLRWEFLLVHYDQQTMWSSRHFAGMDPWNVYHGFFQECRSPVVNLLTMEYVLLPFAKFRNLNEAPEYSEAAVAERIEKAKVVEISDKLDGSMIQMARIGDERFWNGVIVATSGSLYPDKAFQLRDVLDYLREHGEYGRFLAEAPGGNTYLFEWIDANDLHVVRYSRAAWGLHLIGRRSMISGALWPTGQVVKMAEEYGIQTTELYEDSLQGILGKLDDYSAAEKEGYVLYIDGFQVKVKCTDFVGSAKLMRVVLNFNFILKNVADGTLDDLLAKAGEEYRDKIMEQAKRILDFQERMLRAIEREYARLPVSGEKKDVMIWIDSRIRDPYGLIRSAVRTKYLGRKIEILAKHRGGATQYLSENTVRYYEESGLI